MKKCSRCKRNLPRDAFSINRAKRDGLQTSCKPCRAVYNKDYYQGTKERYAEVRAAAAIKAREQATAWIIEYLLARACVDCGTKDLRLLEFDHLSDKVMDVGPMVRGGYSISKIAAEVAKCDVVCANCHRIRTHERAGSWRVEAEAARQESLIDQ